MNVEKIETALGYFWGSFIENIEVDLCSFKIKLSIMLYKSENTFEKHSMIFEGVSAFFFANGAGDARFKTQSWERAELSEAHFYNTPPHHLKHLDDKKGRPSSEAHPNFYLEIWSTAFLIEAKGITIDETTYDVY